MSCSRAGLTESGKKTIFLYYNGEILTESDGESAPVRRYLNGIGLSHVQTLEDGLYHAYHQDEQGNTAYITEENRQVQNSYQYDAFGNLLESKEDIENRILYTGQQYDQVTGQYYLRARYYNPVVGRFLQEDTYRGDGLNLYAYCANNPVMYYDPSGHKIENDCIIDKQTKENEITRTASVDSTVNELPQGISEEAFRDGSALIKEKVGDISDDIVVHGSRASGTAKPTSDIDIAIRVTPEKFDELIQERFKIPNPGSAKERTMLHAIQTGKIHSGEAGLRGLRKELEQIFDMDVDISIIKKGGLFDNPPFIPIQ